MYRFADVSQTLANARRAVVQPLPVVLNIDDQLDTIRSHQPPRVFMRINGPDRAAHRAARQGVVGVALHLVRAFVPEVVASSTGWLNCPILPQLLTPAQARARAYRLEAEADGNSDAATSSALVVRRSLTSRAALMYINELGAVGHRLLGEHLPFDLMAERNLPEIVEEVRELCGMWELLDRLRIRCETRAAAVGLPFPRDGYRFFRLAALDMFAIGEYIARFVPMYEDIMDEMDHVGHNDPRGPWSTIWRVDPEMVPVERDDGEDCPICWGGNDDCAELVKPASCSHPHKFGRACFARWCDDQDEKKLPRTCPICRVFSGCLLECFECGASGDSVQLWKLGGGCACSAAFCLNCSPRLESPCPSCRHYIQPM